MLLESPQTHFRFRRFGTNTKMCCFPPRVPTKGKPTNGVTGPDRGATDCRDEAERCCRRWWIALSFRPSNRFQFLVSLCRSKVLCLNDIRASLGE